MIAPLDPDAEAILASVAEIAARAAARSGLEDIWSRVSAGERLSPEQGLRLYREPDLLALGAMAEFDCLRRHGRKVFYNINQHINYTNVCNKRCRFCAFQRLPGHEGAYTMSPADAASKIRERLNEPITEVHMVGGVNPSLPYEYYLDLLRAVKEAKPLIHIKAFTMVEIHQIQKKARKALPEVYADLIEAGLGSLPGGGAEIFAERVWRELFPLKIGADRWMELAREAHRAGLRSNATILYGHIETIEERIDHMARLRTLQDETGGFQALVPLAFHPANTELDHLPAPTAADSLRAIAVARLFVDNFDHIKSYWVMLSLPVAQMALTYGSNDLDGTVSEEKIYHDAGATTPERMSRADLEGIIRAAGRTPVERDTLYQVVT